MYRSKGQKSLTPYFIEEVKMPDNDNGEGNNLEEDFEGDSTFPFIKVVVGSKAQAFYILKTPLMEASPFFKACLSAGMIEQQKQEVILPEDPCRAFNLLKVWVHTHEVKNIGNNKQAMSAIQAWALGDKYCIPKFQNALIDELKEYWTQWHVHPQFLSWVVKHTKKETPLHQLVCDQLIHDLVNCPYPYRCKDDEDWVDSADKVVPAGEGIYVKPLKDLLAHPEIGSKLFWATHNLERGGADPASSGGCYYHVHEQGETCSKEKPGKK
ncbi:uncharacterized protein Z520_01378 [Fonsecaea multimorphosa CBS 102226]|uniref:Uncharacterized protein n=1 Tax=Fonsecaea multimorphosa CBS 102226 TaxID=1442371 RepID=A0A0D2KA79_9EURO|nr:uncharacterized protein Z520_01378 [Fonsecaea multimorphosa CBS 102226]KIY02913.1 hypothetical protein Z520_01378 [Fonsecaea multimorphosa CBS 102226]